MESVRSYSPTGISLPRVLSGSAPASAVSGLARCLLHITACRLAKSPKATLYIRGFSGFVTSTTAPIATGRSEPVPGRDFQPAVDQRLFTAHQQPLARQLLEPFQSPCGPGILVRSLIKAFRKEARSNKTQSTTLMSKSNTLVEYFVAELDSHKSLKPIAALPAVFM
jgi:hypothetical protein